ncbi:Pept-C1 domain-containing protein [Aphelenchoides besseyi]|nr:Pept-C1 domain-containing protein [Aphelenchoides besseyi]
MSLIVLVSLLSVATAQLVPSDKGNLIDVKFPIGKDLVDFINSKATTFKAQVYPRFENLSIADLRQFLGALSPTPEQAAIFQKQQPAEGPQLTSAVSIPTSFDVRTKWPKCNGTFNAIPNQASKSPVVDRVGLFPPLVLFKIAVVFSTTELQNCRSARGTFCNGGYVYKAFDWFDTVGIVTGGQYGGKGCKPYEVAPGQSPPANRTCKKSCQASYTSPTYPNDKKKGGYNKIFYNNTAAAQAEILANGSIVAQFDVYYDFYNYKSGIYQHVSGNYVGGHAVRLIGWGVDNGTQYWLAANSWGVDWGDKGFFKIRRGNNECNFEKWSFAGNVLKD